MQFPQPANRNADPLILIDPTMTPHRIQTGRAQHFVRPDILPADDPLGAGLWSRLGDQRQADIERQRANAIYINMLVLLAVIATLAAIAIGLLATLVTNSPIEAYLPSGPGVI